MSLCVVAFPDMSEADARWLQSIRVKYDPQHDAIAPHVTLLFPSKEFEVDELAAHVEAVARDAAPFDMTFRCAMPYRDPLSSRYYLFLLPDEGLSKVVRLHDQLRRRVFPNRSRVDVPFIPHVTIGAFEVGDKCLRVADEINAERFTITSRINTLSIVSGEGVAVKHWEIPLGGVQPRFATTDREIDACFPVMVELRPHLKPEDFVARVRAQQAAGYQLAYIEAEGRPVAVAGFRTGENLAWGKFLYVDDLVTAAAFRSRGYGAALLRWLRDVAASRGCRELHLDSGVARTDAHRFYRREGMDVSSYHFKFVL